jgi:hypothetical protein
VSPPSVESQITRASGISVPLPASPGIDAHAACVVTITSLNGVIITVGDPWSPPPPRNSFLVHPAGSDSVRVSWQDVAPGAIRQYTTWSCWVELTSVGPVAQTTWVTPLRSVTALGCTPVPITTPGSVGPIAPHAPGAVSKTIPATIAGTTRRIAPDPVTV